MEHSELLCEYLWVCTRRGSERKHKHWRQVLQCFKSFHGTNPPLEKPAESLRHQWGKCAENSDTEKEQIYLPACSTPEVLLSLPLRSYSQTWALALTLLIKSMFNLHGSHWAMADAIAPHKSQSYQQVAERSRGRLTSSQSRAAHRQQLPTL